VIGNAGDGIRAPEIVVHTEVVCRNQGHEIVGGDVRLDLERVLVCRHSQRRLDRELGVALAWVGGLILAVLSTLVIFADFLVPYS
jgi:hypothetical protein